MHLLFIENSAVLECEIEVCFFGRNRIRYCICIGVLKTTFWAKSSSTAQIRWQYIHMLPLAYYKDDYVLHVFPSVKYLHKNSRYNRGLQSCSLLIR
jgi:hypothetical protein